MIRALAQMLAEKLELKGWNSNVLLKPMGYDLLSNKFTIVMKTSELSRKFIVKVSNSANLNEFLSEEANSILVLVGSGVKGIPEIILHGSLDDRYFMAQEFIEGQKPHSASGTFDAAYSLTRDWLLSLRNKTAGKEMAGEQLMKTVESFTSISSEYFPVLDSLSLMDKYRPSCGIPTSWAHGDFWHGNLIIDSKGGLWVTDFAFSSPNQPPIDVLDLIADYDPLIFLSPEMIQKYTSGFVPREVNPLFLVLYSLNRRIALKVRVKKRLYEELLVLNMSEELSKIEEAGILQSIVSAINSGF
ncbi:MAG: aminoglycoside phosphotransferase family protein [Nitrososphaerales archaeon]|jgi:hypothetical protein